MIVFLEPLALRPECHPAVQCRCPLFASTAGFHTGEMSSALDQISQADFFLGDEAGQSNAMTRGLAGPGFGEFLFTHDARLLFAAASSRRHASETFIKGGTTQLRFPSPRIAILIWAAVNQGNRDQRSAIAPVTNGQAALVPLKVANVFPGPSEVIS